MRERSQGGRGLSGRGWRRNLLGGGGGGARIERQRQRCGCGSWYRHLHEGEEKGLVPCGGKSEYDGRHRRWRRRTREAAEEIGDRGYGGRGDDAIDDEEVGAHGLSARVGFAL